MLFLLGLWGCLAIYNATFYSDAPFYFVGRQFAWLMAGMFCLYVASQIPFGLYRDMIWPLAVFAYIPLISVLFFGIAVNGMRGWFSAGSVFIQPSEFAKAPFIMLLCWLNSRIENDFKRFIAMLAMTFVWVIPVALEPDLGTAFVFLTGFLIVYWVGGGRILYLGISLMAVVPAAAFFIYRNKYVVARVTGFLNPADDPLGSGWHVMQFQYTLARGGFWGASWGKALWANSYLPLSHSDSAFASLVESVGFIGSFPVIVGLLGIAGIAYFLAAQKEDNLKKTLIFSLGALFVTQALIHISVNVTLVPPTGITLPILSYGGSSLVSTMIAFGVLLSAANDRNY